MAAICSDKLGEDLVILDMEDVVGYTDAFVICSGGMPDRASAARKSDRS